MISTTNMNMLALLAEVLHGQKPESVPEEEWPIIHRELSDHAVCALLSEYVYDLGLLPEEENKYLRDVVRNRQIFHRLMKEQKRVLNVLKNAEIPTVVLKGAASAMSYSEPENRCMGDIDLLVLPQDLERASEALLAEECRMEPMPESNTRHVCLFGKDNVRIELHNRFSSSDNLKQNDALDEMIYRAIPNRETALICGYDVPVLPPMENGLVLLSHINQHLSKGIGLRHIIDWMLYVEKHLDDEAWESCFAERAERIGMRRLAILVTATCQKYLGLREDIRWCRYEPICDELMEYILAHGNFGKKVDEVKTLTVSVLKKTRNPFHAFTAAQSVGLTKWKAAKRHRWLRPFAWCYQMVRWVRRGMKYGVTAGMLTEASASAKEEADFLKRLGVTRI